MSLTSLQSDALASESTVPASAPPPPPSGYPAWAMGAGAASARTGAGTASPADVAGILGMGDFLDAPALGAIPTPGASAQTTRTVTTLTDVKIHSTPGKTTPVVGTMSKGETAPVLEVVTLPEDQVGAGETRTWLKVKAAEGTGYVTSNPQYVDVEPALGKPGGGGGGGDGDGDGDGDGGWFPHLPSLPNPGDWLPSLPNPGDWLPSLPNPGDWLPSLPSLPHLGNPLDWLPDWGHEDPAPPDKGAPQHGGRVLPEATIRKWIDLGVKVDLDKRAAGKATDPFDVKEIDGWLVDLEKDLGATDDPRQKLQLGGVKFQLESTKHGTHYQKDGGVHDYDPAGTYDCSEAVMQMLNDAGLGGLIGEAIPDANTVAIVEVVEGIYGEKFGGEPKIGSLMMWRGKNGHVALVVDIRKDDNTFIVSQMAVSGSRMNSFDLTDPSKSDPKRNCMKLGDFNGEFIGYWSPLSARLPPSQGEGVAGPKGGMRGNKYYAPNNDAWASQFDQPTAVDILKDEGDFTLVRVKESGGAAWVRQVNLTRAPAPGAPGAPKSPAAPKALGQEEAPVGQDVPLPTGSAASVD